MLLAGDIGGTKALVGLFEPTADRPREVAVRSYRMSSFAHLAELLDAFEADLARPLDVEAAAFGVAGPVVNRRVTLTSALWTIDAAEMATRLRTTRIDLLNDLEAMAASVVVLRPDEVAVLQAGSAQSGGNAAVIAAGTGLGEACLHRVSGRLLPVPSEGGHADFAARTDRELEFVRMLRDRYGRVEVEQVVSGPGLVNLHAFTHRGGSCEMLDGVDAADAPARVSQAGMGGRCQGCTEALRMFVSAYGAEAGNLALRSVATAGLFVGGGIAAKIRPVLETGLFMDAFRAKAPMNALVDRIPVKVILNAEAGLLGAAVRAQALLFSRPAP